MRTLTVFLDARCLQDPDFRNRGIGSHIASLVLSITSVSDRNPRLIAMIDPGLPPLAGPIRDRVDAVVSHANPVIPADGALFIAASPMTHSPSRFMRLVGHERVLSAALVYDFIPYDLPGYLSTPASALRYAACLQWLKSYDLFFPISRFTAERLRHHASVQEGKTFVTGCAIRQSLQDALAAEDKESQVRPSGSNSRYFLLFTGDNPRKNPGVALRALDALQRWGRDGFFMKVAGIQPAAARKWLDESRNDVQRAVEVVGDVSDADLRRLYGDAIATIVPSLMEGFSLPVAESVACGTPVIASEIAVHREFLTDPAALFDANDSDALASRMISALDDDGWRARLLSTQRHVAVNATPDLVWRRFWVPLLETFDGRRPSVRGRRWATPRRPRIALVTPFPPEQSGVARYSADTVSALSELCEVSVFTDAPPSENPGPEHSRIAGQIDVGPLLHPSLDAVVLVAGNSHFHHHILDLCERYGGPTVLHDSRLTPIYAQRLGRAEFVRRVVAICGRQPPEGDVDEWLRHEDPPPLFLDSLAYMAAPLIVHTEPSRDLVQRIYAVDAALVPFATTPRLTEAGLTQAARAAARARIGVAPETLLITSFGYSAASKGTLECIQALRHLRDWNIPAELHTAGSDAYLNPSIARAVRELGLSSCVRLHRQFLPEHHYEDYLCASDVAVQLRTFSFGQFSAALAECIGSGLPCVASADLADACDAPSTVQRVPNGATALQIAESIRIVHESRSSPPPSAERLSYLERHSFQMYARRLLEVLGF